MASLFYGTLDDIGRLAKWSIQATRVFGGTETEAVVIREVAETMSQAVRGYVRFAGLSGALAVGLGAYGAHVFRPSEADPQLKLVFETGNRYHFMHTLALLAVPLVHRPHIVGPIMVTGMLLFSGSCYAHALTGNTSVRKVTPWGGMLLIVGWIAMVL